MKRIKKTVCLILVLLLAALVVAGCTSTNIQGGIARDANGNVVLLGEHSQSSDNWLICRTSFAGEIPSLTFSGSKISVTSAGANYGQVTVTQNHTDNNLTLDAKSAVGFLYVQEGAHIKVNNTVGLVKNALIESGGVAWFDKMPEMLVIKPGGQAYVNGVLYDNTNGTEDRVLSPNSNSEGSGSAQIALSAPTITGSGEIHLEAGYSDAE